MITRRLHRLPSVLLRPVLCRSTLSCRWVPAWVSPVGCVLLLWLRACIAFGQASFWPERTASVEAIAVITNLAQLRGLERPEAKRQIPVRLQAIVTYCEDQWPSLFVQEGGHSSYVYRPKEAPPLSAGDRIEIEGLTGEGFTPLIQASAIRKIGTAELPAAVETTLNELVTGRYDGRRVRVKTTVRWMHITYRRLYLHIGDGTGRYEVHIPEFRAALPVHLVGAEVELTGITGTKLDTLGHVIGAGMSLARLEELRVLRPAPADPWARSAQVINTLTYFHPSTSFGQQTKIRGVVTLNTPSGRLYVEDASGGCEVRLPAYQERPDDYGQYLEPARPPDLHLGDEVDVLGYPDIGSFSPVLTDALVRKKDVGKMPEPMVLIATNVVKTARDSRRIRTQGRIVASEVHIVKTGVQQRLTLGEKNEVFFAEFEGSAPLDAPVDSLVEITGICAMDADERRRVSGFRMLLSAAEDLRILKGPPLVTTRGLLQVGTPFAALVFGWIWSLRRQVRRRTLQLRSANSELRHEVDQRIRAEQLLKERVRVMSLSADVAIALNESTELRPMLQHCAELLVRHLDAVLARVWTLNDAEQVLELQASAGAYSHLDGPHGRVPLGQFKIGLIAQERQAHLTNEVETDPRVSDKEWARREGIVAFAGYPLLVDGRVLGVVAVFARRRLGDEVLQALGLAAHSLALGIERKRAESSRRDGEARLRTVVQHNPAGILVLDADAGKFIDANEMAERLIGYPRDEICQGGPLHTSAALQADGRPSAEVAAERIAEVLQRGSATFDWISRHASGRDFPVEVRAARIPIAGRNLIVASLVDITNRKRAEAELLKALERERELGELKTRFVSMVSHEFRTPLEVIVSSADILGRYLDRLEGSERAEHLAAIQRSVRRMADMMEDVLLLGRFESDRQQFRPDDVHLAGCCRRLADEMRSATGGKCPVQLDIAPELPLGRVDESLLRHILTNLVSNAVKYSPAGATVWLRLSREGHQAVFQVQDSGMGIPAEDQAHLFQAFHRGRNVYQIPGTGLGLVVVKRSVEMHGGDIEFVSEEGQGTTFTVRLPVFDSADL